MWQTADECTQCQGVSAAIWEGLKRKSPEHMETHMLSALRLQDLQALSAHAFAACCQVCTSYWEGQCLWQTAEKCSQSRCRRWGLEELTAQEP